MERVLSAAERAGAKVVLVRDPEQLQAIEAGAAEITAVSGSARSGSVRRRRTGYGADGSGSRAVCGGRHGAGVGTCDEARADLVAGWEAAQREWPEESRVILAYTRDDVRDLNEKARAQLRTSGDLRTPDQTVQTERGEGAVNGG